ncbi:5-dehydro-2-deoxygluconokinase [Propionibacteriaceae bacterium G57]|uniref:5-dehydro-2-deoxygluconokinase n=1 Tax=Aestuariimicrobium sp. G57 TaxID=3418485 RepID=UPI003DA6F757
MSTEVSKSEVRKNNVITMGRIGVDLYPLQTGVGLEEVESFGKFLGGSSTNVAVAAARLGNPDVATVTAVGDDPFGRWLRTEMRRLGVRDDYVETSKSLLTPITFCEIFPPDNFPLYFYRRPSAPDLEISPYDIPLRDIVDAGLFWFTGTGLSQEPSYWTHMVALEHRNRARHTVFDLDWREMFWRERHIAQDRYAEALKYATVAVGNREECEVAVGETVPDRAADALLERGVELAIVKQGPKGTLAKSRDERVEVPPTRATTVNGLGAGDAFGGSIVDGLLRGLSLKDMIERASAAGAIVASRLECSTAMPTPDEIDRVVAAGNTDVLLGK